MAKTDRGFVSIAVEEPLAPLIVTLAKGRTIRVEGMTPGGAAVTDWSTVVEIALKLAAELALHKRQSGGGGSGVPTGCVNLQATNPDGSTFKYEWCPPSGTA